MAKPTLASPPANTSSIFNNRSFMLLWAAQFITQTAQQAVWFGMIIVVEQVSKSSLHLSAAMLSTIVPGVLFGLVAGVIVDRSNKKSVLIASNLLRAAVVLGYLLYTRSLYAVYAANFVFVAISQFFGPAEAATIPALVHKRHLVAANSLFNLTFTVSQLVGIVVVAPWIVKFFGASALFAAIAAIYLVAGIMTAFLPAGQRPERSLSGLRGSAVVRTVRDELHEALTFITRDRQTWWSMVFVTLASTLTLILAMLAPRYVVVEVGIQPEDAVFLFAPAGLGIFLMTLVMTPLANQFGATRLARAGSTIAGGALVAMALIPIIGLAGSGVPSTALVAPGNPFQSQLVLPLMIVSAGIGVGFALANIPSQSVLMERAPVDTRGRIFSVLLLLGNVAAIAPLAFLGALADLYGVNNVVGLVGVLTLVVTAVAIREETVNRSGRVSTGAHESNARVS
jgi:MFS family permease